MIPSILASRGSSNKKHQIPDRTQFKHVVFGPQLWSDSDDAFFPAIRDMVEAERWEDAKRQIAKAATLMRGAASVLVIE